MCPYVSGKRFYVLVALVALVIVAMSTVAIVAVVRGKDGVITGACCGAMSAAVCGVLVGAGRRRQGTDNENRGQSLGVAKTGTGALCESVESVESVDARSGEKEE